MDRSGGTEKTQTVILVFKKTERVILVALKMHCDPLVPVVTNSKKTQYDGKPDFPCVPEIHSVMKTQHDGKPDFLCVLEIHSVMQIQHDGKPYFQCVPDIRSVPLVYREDSVRPEEPFDVHSDDQSRYRWQQDDSWPQNTNFIGHYGNFSERDNWLPVYHQMEQFMNWRSDQRGDMEMPQLTRYEMPYQSRESDPFRKLEEAEEDREIAPTY